MKTKIKRFSPSLREKHHKEIISLQQVGPVSYDAELYVGMLVDDKLVAGIWIAEENEICYITRYGHRKRGYMTRLVKIITKDVADGKLDRVIASPINHISEDILERCGFFDGKRKLRGFKVFE